MIDHLLAALEREAAQQVAAVRAASESEAARISGDSDARLARRKREALGAREAELRGAAEAAIGAARRTARRAVLEARARFLGRVFDAARAIFPATLDTDAYRAALPEHVAEALRALSDEAAVIRCPPGLSEIVRRAAGDRKGVTVRGDPGALPGVTATSSDGAIVVDNTLDGRLDRLRSELAIELLARVAEDAGA